MKTINRLYNSVILIFAIPILTVLVFFNAINTCYVESGSEHTMYLPDSITGNLAAVIILLAIMLLARNNRFFHSLVERINSDEKFYLRIRNLILSAIFLFCFLWVVSSQFIPSGDQIAVQNSAFLFEIGQYDLFSPGAYIERYQNQLGLMLFSWALGKVFGFHNYLVFQLLNCIAVTVVFLELTRICRLFHWSRMTAVGILIVGAVFFPLIILCSFVYGNWLGLMFAIIAVRTEVEFLHKFRFWKALSAVISISLAILLKSNYLIFFIGMVIVAVADCVIQKKPQGCFFVLLLLAGYCLQSIMPKAFVRVTTGIELNQGEPIYNWIAMGLSEGERGPGWYNGLNHILYERSNFDTSECAEMAKYEINHSIQAFHTDHQFAVSFFERKVASMWSSPTFLSYFIFKNRECVHEQSGLVQAFLSMGSEIKCTAYLNSFCFLIYVGALFCILLYPSSSESHEELLFFMIVTGGFLFHLGWEVKALYALPYFLILIPCSIKGYSLVVNGIEQFIGGKVNSAERRALFKARRLNAAAFCFTCLALLLIGVRYGFHSLQTDHEMFETYVQNETRPHPFTGEYRLLSKTGGSLTLTDKGEPVLSLRGQGTSFSMRGYNDGQIIRTSDYKYLTPVSEYGSTDRDDEIIMSSDTRPFHNWRIQYMDDEFFRIRYKNLALAVDENSGEIRLCRAERNKDNQLWRAIKTE